jgi:hypothetical protein
VRKETTAGVKWMELMTVSIISLKKCGGKDENVFII